MKGLTLPNIGLSFFIQNQFFSLFFIHTPISCSQQIIEAITIPGENNRTTAYTDPDALCKSRCGNQIFDSFHYFFALFYLHSGHKQDKFIATIQK